MGGMSPGGCKGQAAQSLEVQVKTLAWAPCRWLPCVGFNLEESINGTKKQNGCLRRPYKLAVKRQEVKSKGEKERYTQLNAEFQRIARRVRTHPSVINAKK